MFYKYGTDATKNNNNNNESTVYWMQYQCTVRMRFDTLLSLYLDYVSGITCFHVYGVTC